MRLDKFLQLARLIKSRKFAKEACERGYVFLNGRQAKPSAQVKPGDRVVLDLPKGLIEIEVLAIPETKTISKEAAKGLYRVLREVRKSG